MNESIRRGTTSAVVAAIAFASSTNLAGCSARAGPRLAGARIVRHLAADTLNEKTVAAGEAFGAELGFSAGTGYGWIAAGFDPAIVALESQRSRPATDEKLVGGPMIEQFAFRGVAPGETTVRFELRRPWEKDVSPVDVRELRVTVTASRPR